MRAMVTSSGISPARTPLNALMAVFGRDPHGYGTLANAIRAAMDAIEIRTEDDRRMVAETVMADWDRLEAIGAVALEGDSRMWRLTDRGRTLLHGARAEALQAV